MASKRQGYDNLFLLLFIFSIFLLYFYLLFLRKQLKLKTFLGTKQKTTDKFKNSLDYLDRLVNKDLFMKQVPNLTVVNQENNEVPLIQEQEQISTDYYRDLYQMYINGVHDTYDIDQNKIYGIVPNAQKAIEISNEIISRADHTDRDLLNLALIYKNGMHNFEPNLDKAEEIYIYIINNCSTEDVYIEAKESLDYINKFRVHSWLNLKLPQLPKLDNNYFDQVTQQLNQNQNQNQNQREQRPQNIRRQNIFMGDDLIFDLDLDLDPDTLAFNQAMFLDTVPIRQRQRQRPDDNLQGRQSDSKNYNDPQNTHNTTVVSTVKQSINNLQDLNLNIDQNKTIQEIRSMLLNRKQTDKIRDALRALDTISNDNTKLMSTDKSTKEALALVYNRFDTLANQGISRSNLEDNLVDSLSNMIEHDQIVCKTGQFNNIVSTLDHIDPLVSIKPLYAIREEMLSKAAVIRNENPELEDQGLRDKITNELKKEYVSTGVLTDQKFNLEINGWINDI